MQKKQHKNISFTNFSTCSSCFAAGWPNTCASHDVIILLVTVWCLAWEEAAPAGAASTATAAAVAAAESTPNRWRCDAQASFRCPYNDNENRIYIEVRSLFVCLMCVCMYVCMWRGHLVDDDVNEGRRFKRGGVGWLILYERVSVLRSSVWWFWRKLHVRSEQKVPNKFFYI